MSAPNDPNSPPPEFVLSPSPAGPASNRPLAKTPAPRRAEAAVKAVKARGEPEHPEHPERQEHPRKEAQREEPSGFGAVIRKILGREPTAPEAEELYRVRDALDLRDNDALWLVLLALHHQRREFEQSIDRRLAEARNVTDALVESARARFLEQFPAALKLAARKVAIKALGFNGPVVLSGPVAGVALVVASLGFIGAGWLAYELGQRAGYEQGVLVQRAESTPKPPVPPAKGR